MATKALLLQPLREYQNAYSDTVDPDVLRRKIVPNLGTSPVARLASAGGLPLRYASLIRRSEQVPHPVHWEALRALGMQACLR